MENEVVVEIPRYWTVEQLTRRFQGWRGLELVSIQEVEPQHFEVVYKVNTLDIDVWEWDYWQHTMMNDFHVLPIDKKTESPEHIVITIDVVLQTRPLTVRGAPEFVRGYVEAHSKQGEHRNV